MRRKNSCQPNSWGNTCLTLGRRIGIMKKSIIGLVGLFIILAIIGTVWFRSGGPAMITLTNGSSMTITNVQVDGGRFAQFIGTMTPGMSASFTLGQSRLNDVWVSFGAAGKTYDSRGKSRPNYFAASSRWPLSLSIGPDLTVH
jgi:hypothetical protein